MWRTLRRCLGAIFSKGCFRPPGSTQRWGRRLTTRSSSPPFKSSWRMHSASMHALKKKSVANGGGEALPIALAYWPKPKRCYSTTAPNSSPSLGDYCRSERHESTSARFDTNRHPRNGPESCSYSCARTGAAADQSAGKGARKSNRTDPFRLAVATPRTISSPISSRLQRDTERRPRNSDRQFHSKVKINHRAATVARDDQPMMF